MRTFREHRILEEEISRADLVGLEKYVDKQFAKVGVDIEFSKHFIDRLKDARNKKPITMAELVRLFKQTFKKYGKKIAQLGDKAQAVMHDMKTDINVPFVLNWDKKSQEFDLMSKTIMRKGDLVKRINFPILSDDPDPPLKSYVEQLKRNWTQPCIVVKGPYEAVYSETKDAKKRTTTVVRLAIDVLYEGELRKELFPQDFEKI